MLEVIFDRATQSGEALARRLENSPYEGAVNWTGVPQDTPMLNQLSRSNKLAQLIRLELVKIPVPYFTIFPSEAKGEHWLPRSLNHQQGRDLTRRAWPEGPDYWVGWLPLEREGRIHVFRRPKGAYVVLRSALKVPKDEKAHPWIRSHRLGWKLSYVGGASEEVKRVARAAVAALQLDFGAVDVGEVMGEPVVLEVNTCPGLDSGTLEMYAEEIERRFK